MYFVQTEIFVLQMSDEEKSHDYFHVSLILIDDNVSEIVRHVTIYLVTNSSHIYISHPVKTLITAAGRRPRTGGAPTRRENTREK